jgi:hypothetical protein
MSDSTPPLDEGRDASPAVPRRIPVDSSRSMRAIAGEVSELLDGLEERPRQCGALLASELIAQVAGPASQRDHRAVEFTVQLRADAVHLEAMGPVAPTLAGESDDDLVLDDPLADWGAFLIDRLADRWGLNGGYRRAIWAEIAIPA